MHILHTDTVRSSDKSEKQMESTKSKAALSAASTSRLLAYRAASASQEQQRWLLTHETNYAFICAEPAFALMAFKLALWAKAAMRT
jgi:hypothetical protein